MWLSARPTSTSATPPPGTTSALGILPAVLWIVNDPDRQQALSRAPTGARGLTPGLHRVVLGKDFLTTVLAGNTTPADL